MSKMGMNTYQTKLRFLMDEFAHYVYKITRQFPKEELFGARSQLRRAALSMPLNYIEGFGRRRAKVKLNFYETSYGSLDEARYLLEFSFEEKWIDETQYAHGLKLADEIGAMLWTEINQVEKYCKEV